MKAALQEDNVLPDRARMINEQRKSRGLKRLEVIVILRSNVHMLSSSFIREIIKNEGKL